MYTVKFIHENCGKGEVILATQKIMFCTFNFQKTCTQQAHNVCKVMSKLMFS